MRGELFGEKFLKHAGDRASSNADRRILEGEPNPAAGCRVVSIRNAARCQCAQHIGVIWLPSSVVAFANDRVDHCVKEPRFTAARSLVEIPGILFEKRRQNRTPNERSRDKVGISCAKAFGVALGPLSVAAVGVAGLLNSG